MHSRAIKRLILKGDTFILWLKDGVNSFEKKFKKSDLGKTYFLIPSARAGVGRVIESTDHQGQAIYLVIMTPPFIKIVVDFLIHCPQKIEYKPRPTSR